MGLNKFLREGQNSLSLPRIARVCSAKLGIAFTKKGAKIASSGTPFETCAIRLALLTLLRTEEHAIPLRKVGPKTAGLNFYGISPRFHNSARRFNFLVAGTSLGGGKENQFRRCSMNISR